MRREPDYSAPTRASRVVPGKTGAPSLRSAARDGRLCVADMQRARLLGGAVAAVQEVGWAQVSVASITSRARVSRRTFYDLFGDREDCLLAVCEDTLQRIESELVSADLGELSWSERMRAGLWVILSFFDREPELARVCAVQSAHGGPAVLAWRADLLARLTELVDEGRSQAAKPGEIPGLTAEGSVGAVLAIVTGRLLDDQSEPWSELLGALLGMIVLPYLGARAALREHKRALPQLPASWSPTSSSSRAYRAAGENPLRKLPMRVTYRTGRVLGALAQHPGASNREIGELAGIHDQGQVSKLLARLQGHGLLANSAGPDARAKGAPNAWSLTDIGERVIEHLRLDLESHRDAA